MKYTPADSLLRSNWLLYSPFTVTTSLEITCPTIFMNMVGQVISNEVVTVNGLYNNQFDLSNESAGVYFIKFTTEEGVLTERITVE